MTQDRSTPLESVVEKDVAMIRSALIEIEMVGGPPLTPDQARVAGWALSDRTRLADRVEELESIYTAVVRLGPGGNAGMGLTLREVAQALSTQPHQD